MSDSNKSPARFFDKLILTIGDEDIEAFEAQVKQAAELGVTHVQISTLVGRTEYTFGENELNPWTEWSVIYPGLFKFAPPKELEDVYATAFVEKQRATLKARHEIVAAHGMKSAFYAHEPMWLPDRIYRKHPNWRGGRPDNANRTSGLVFSPCVDEPEVLALYGEAVRGICDLAPSVDTFLFWANDAGGAYCWLEDAYPGQNGPTACRGRSMAERVMGFMRAIRDAARENGREASAFVMPTHFTQAQVEAMRVLVEPGAGLFDELIWTPAVGARLEIAHDDRKDCFLSRFQGGEVSPFDFADRAHQQRSSGKKRFFVQSPSSHDYLVALKCFLEEPNTDTLPRRFDLVHRIAGAQYAPELADDVFEAWHVVRQAHLECKIATMSCCQAQKWLVRPLLGTQEFLTDGEMAYFSRWLYQLRPEDKRNYLASWHDDQRLIEGYRYARHLRAMVLRGVKGLRKAASIFRRAAGKTSEAELQRKLELAALSLEAKCCVWLNYYHTSMVAVITLDRERYEDRFEQATDPFLPAYQEGSRQLAVIYEMMREELDNTYDLIGILERAAPVKLLCEGEGYWMYGTNLIEQLKRKAELMLDHWRDVDRLYFLPTKGT